MYEVLRWLNDKNDEVFESDRKKPAKIAMTFAVTLFDYGICFIFGYGLGAMGKHIRNLILKKK